MELEEPFIHPAATVIGLVEMEAGCSIWPGAVLRADMNRIRLGRAVNIQDNTTVHVENHQGVEIGDYTLVGHNAMLHGCRIGRGCLIGIGCIVLDGAQIGTGAMLTAGCMIRGGMKIPPRALVIQKEGKLIIREHKARTEATLVGSLEYVALVRRHREGQWGPFTEEEKTTFRDRAKELNQELEAGDP